MSQEYERKTYGHDEPQVMGKGEAREYTGLTLNEEGKKEEYQEESIHTGIHIRTVNLNQWPWWKKIFGIIAFLVFLVFAWFFLIWALILAAVGAILFWLRNLLFRS